MGCSIRRSWPVLVVFVVAGCGGSSADAPADAAADPPGVSAAGRSDGAAESEWMLLAEGEVTRGDGALRVVDDATDLADAWALAGLESGVPDVDFDDRVVVVGTMSYGSGCEPIFAEVAVRRDAIDPIELQFVAFEPGHDCGADERWYALAVAIDRGLVAPGDTIGWLGGSVVAP